MSGAKKKARTSKSQFDCYVGMLEQYAVLRTGRLTPNMTPKDIEDLWKMVVQKLNACGDGPTRDTDGWKKVFTEWKSQVRKKAREGKSLSDIENRMLRATGKIAVEGIVTIPELGTNEVQNVINTLPNVIVEYEYSDINVGHEVGSTPSEELEIGNEPIATASSSNDKEVQAHKTTSKRTNTKASNKLLEAYMKSANTHKEGLTDIAAGLDAISKGRIKIKTTQEQYGIYLSFLEKFKYEQNFPENEFIKMCSVLNSCRGPTRDPLQWKQVFREWISKIKIKARTIYNHRMQTGGGMPITDILTDIENKLLSIINIIVVIGMPVQELGLTKPTKFNMKTTFLARKKVKHFQGLKKSNKQLKVHYTALAAYKNSITDMHKVFKSCVTTLSSCERLVNILLAKKSVVLKEVYL